VVPTLSKKRKPSRSSSIFYIQKVFPPSDALAIDLLRLMAASNDIRHIDEWMNAHLQTPKEKLAHLVAAGRWYMQLRLAAAVIHEALNVLIQMHEKGHLTALSEGLDARGKKALATLRRIMDGTDRDMKQLLEQVRHKGTFHYDHGQFRKSLTRIVTKHGPQEQSRIIWEPEGLFGTGAYFHNAEALRTEGTIGLVGDNPSEGLDRTRTILSVMETFQVFLGAAFYAYVRVRNLQGEFQDIDG